jgi:hypothetical protein
MQHDTCLLTMGARMLCCSSKGHPTQARLGHVHVACKQDGCVCVDAMWPHRRCIRERPAKRLQNSLQPQGQMGPIWRLLLVLPA